MIVTRDTEDLKVTKPIERASDALLLGRGNLRTGRIAHALQSAQANITVN